MQMKAQYALIFKEKYQIKVKIKVTLNKKHWELVF